MMTYNTLKQHEYEHSTLEVSWSFFVVFPMDSGFFHPRCPLSTHFVLITLPFAYVVVSISCVNNNIQWTMANAHNAFMCISAGIGDGFPSATSVVFESESASVWVEEAAAATVVWLHSTARHKMDRETECLCSHNSILLNYMELEAMSSRQHVYVKSGWMDLIWNS